MGFSNSFSYKGFDLSISMRGAFNYQVLNFPRLHNQPLNTMPLNVLKYATEKPFGGNSYVFESSIYNSYYLEDAGYIKIDNIDLGYTLPVKIKNIESIRFNASLRNWFTFTKYTGIDPEVPISGQTPGYDNNFTYPTIKSLTFGLNINF